MFVNVDPMNPDANGAPFIDELKKYNIHGVRLVLRNDPAIISYIKLAQYHGLAVLGIETEASYGDLLTETPCEIYQLGNEPDLNNVSAADYVKWWDLYYGTWFAQGKPLEGKPAIGAGLASGNVQYWREVQAAGGLKGAAGMSVHPYGKNAAQAKALITSYQKITPSLPIWITEWNRPLAELPAYASMLRQTTVGNAFFCWHDYQDWAIGPERARLLAACA